MGTEKNETLRKLFDSAAVSLDKIVNHIRLKEGCQQIQNLNMPIEA